MTVKIFAPAKINLTLHVTGQRADGYHLLDSLVAFVDIGDQITAQRADQSSLIVTGPFADGVPTDATNLVMKAAQISGLHMQMGLDKRLPPSSGIGGGSTDAAATLKAAARLGASPVTPAQALRLGADVPVCLAAKPMRMRGIGEDVQQIKLPALHMVLVNPRVAVSTPEVFKRLEAKDNAPMPEVLPDWPDGVAFADWLTTQRNDLQRPAVKVMPEIAAVLTALALLPNVLATRMSGSGATCFAVFERREEAEAAAAQLAHGNPWWWVKPASTLPA
ncbi:4-(cytidine 5'-diphospho)-2-C-methyl-D-erythritol kinase [Celeribacter marinus]|uniref:4-diphosphocytidyl-2-C-methyl-D-erythritol kinase n=1 Tax=Celeribacter marinus TaxID=1397108 RepID=A0A0N9ZHN9_9RHOB|nr:4-(cytidine 5'-diphospho)-2-C-methyl-D-erythritol kinase [Celeribacter marinus]ALI55270.1 4-diphosphocytidyl-2-C-methyl-D-erythritolkinase [Celeribacter marinus]SFK11249.1 4-diphosphocytidyl-2-C-methyl-D-erythritol kinase [Celeribacter marinus]